MTGNGTIALAVSNECLLIAFNAIELAVEQLRCVGHCREPIRITADIIQNTMEIYIFYVEVEFN